MKIGEMNLVTQIISSNDNQNTYEVKVQNKGFIL